MKEFSLNLNDASLHDIQLVDTQMMSLHCDVKCESYKEKNIKTNISILTQGNVISDNEGKSTIEINIDSDAFNMSVTQVGIFEKDETVSISTDIFEDFLVTQGIRLLWSFARENVYEITCKMLRKPIMLPTLDVMKTLGKNNRNAREETDENKTKKM